MKDIRRKYKADTGDNSSVIDFDSIVDDIEMESDLLFVEITMKKKYANRFLVTKEYIHWLEEKADLKT